MRPAGGGQILHVDGGGPMSLAESDARQASIRNPEMRADVWPGGVNLKLYALRSLPCHTAAARRKAHIWTKPETPTSGVVQSLGPYYESQ